MRTDTYFSNSKDKDFASFFRPVSFTDEELTKINNYLQLKNDLMNLQDLFNAFEHSIQDFSDIQSRDSKDYLIKPNIREGELDLYTKINSKFDLLATSGVRLTNKIQSLERKYVPKVISSQEEKNTKANQSVITEHYYDEHNEYKLIYNLRNFTTHESNAITFLDGSPFFDVTAIMNTSFAQKKRIKEISQTNTFKNYRDSYIPVKSVTNVYVKDVVEAYLELVKEIRRFRARKVDQDIRVLAYKYSQYIISPENLKRNSEYKSELSDNVVGKVPFFSSKDSKILEFVSLLDKMNNFLITRKKEAENFKRTLK